MFLRAHSEKAVKPPGTRAFAAAMAVRASGPHGRVDGSDVLRRAHSWF